MSMDLRGLGAVRVAKALADPTRFELLRRIAASGEICCRDLVTLLQVSQATVSHHLKILADAGLVTSRREGQFSYFRVRPGALADHGRTLRRAFGQGPARRPPGGPLIPANPLEGRRGPGTWSQALREAAPTQTDQGEADMKRTARIAAVLALAAPAMALAGTSTWNIDPPHTHAGFAVRHLVINTVRGEFGKTTGALVLDDQDVTRSSVEATVDVGTIDTRVADRDTHLKSPDFFDVAKFPTMTFKSTKVEKAGDGKLKVTGNLTLRGVTKPVTLDVTGPTAEIKDPWGNFRRGVSATAKINRKDFGLNWSKTIEAGPVVGDDVAIELDLELVKAGAPKS